MGHLISDQAGKDGQWDTVVCSCRAFKVQDPSRSKRMAAGYRHLADTLDPLEGDDG